VNDRVTALLMRRFYENLFGKRPDSPRPMPKVKALAEAKKWLRGLDATQAEQILSDAGLTRGDQRKLKTVPATKPVCPFEHPYYWAGFVLVGDPN
jgi:CHAT domain-containing protein